MNEFINLYKKRRTVYNLENKISCTNEELIASIKEVITNSPTAFNCQSAKVILLLNKEHINFWNHLVLNELEKVTPAPFFEKTKKKMASFANSYGTLLFFDDTSITKSLMEQYPLYEKMFTIWADHASAMQQIAIWTMLANEGIAASLQHYNPLIDEEVSKTISFNPNWRLIAQMPFGKPLSEPGEKENIDIDQLFKVIS